MKKEEDERLGDEGKIRGSGLSKLPGTNYLEECGSPQWLAVSSPKEKRLQKSKSGVLGSQYKYHQWPPSITRARSLETTCRESYLAGSPKKMADSNI